MEFDQGGRKGTIGVLGDWARLLLDLCGLRHKVNGEAVVSAWIMRYRMRRLPVRDLDGILGKGGLIVLAPHPDDEVIGCGGMIAQARAAGRSVKLIFLTDGSASHPGSTLNPVELARVREAEARAAARILGVRPECLCFLALADSHVPRSGPSFDEAVRRVAAVVRAETVATLVTTAPDDPHPDHRAAHHVARVAAVATGAKLICCPIWQWSLPRSRPTPDRPIRGSRLDVRSQSPLKRLALKAHASQVSAVVADSPRSGKGLFRIAGLPFETYLECEQQADRDADHVCE